MAWNKSQQKHSYKLQLYKTDECYDLKQQIEILIKLGKLKNFLGQDHKDERQPLKGKAEEPLC